MRGRGNEQPGKWDLTRPFVRFQSDSESAPALSLAGERYREAVPGRKRRRWQRIENEKSPEIDGGAFKWRLTVDVKLR